jgi:hypothetical protein
MQKEIRRVKYRVLMGSEFHDRIGLFDVDYNHGGAPVRATMIRTVAYKNGRELDQLGWRISQAMMLDVLECKVVVNLNRGWNGQLEFKMPILRSYPLLI